MNPPYPPNPSLLQLCRIIRHCWTVKSTWVTSSTAASLNSDFKLVRNVSFSGLLEEENARFISSQHTKLNLAEKWRQTTIIKRGWYYAVTLEFNYCITRSLWSVCQGKQYRTHSVLSLALRSLLNIHPSSVHPSIHLTCLVHISRAHVNMQTQSTAGHTHPLLSHSHLRAI